MEPQNTVWIKSEEPDEIYPKSKHTYHEDSSESEEPDVDVTQVLEIKMENDASDHNYHEDSSESEEPDVDVTQVLEIKMETDASDHNEAGPKRCPPERTRLIENSDQGRSISFEEIVNQGVAHSEVEKGGQESLHSTKFGIHTKCIRSPEDSLFSTRSDCSSCEREISNFRCSFCLESFPSKCELVKHVFIHIDGVKPPIYVCRLCAKVFPSENHLKKHLERSDSDQALSDPNNEKSYCSEDYENVDLLEVNEGMNVTELTNRQSLSKDTCNTSLKYLTTHNTHTTTYKAPKLVTSDNDGSSAPTGKVQADVQSANNPYKCDICGKCFTKSGGLKTHTLSHTGKKTHKCDVCGKSFKNVSHLKRHILTHTGEKPYKCDICGKFFAWPDTLKTHILTHTGNKGHKCEFCEKSFTRLSHLKYHTFTHAGIKPHKCDTCGKCYTEASTLKAHILSHTGIKPHRCDICGNTFSHLSNFKRHKLTHTGEKPHKCDICGKCFSLLSTLRLHSVTHTGIKAHKCDICGNSFTCLSNLRRHKLTHRRNKP